MLEKVYALNVEELVEEINEMVELLIDEVILRNEVVMYGGYNKTIINDQLSNLKKRHIGYLLGQADAIINMVKLFNVEIDKNYYNLLRHIQDTYSETM